MLFNSLEFAVFLPIVFFIYWLLNKGNLKIQNIFLLISSYVFYGWWDWRFLLMIMISSSADYMVGVGLLSSDNPRRRKLWLMISIIINLGFLSFFKYYNFFAQSFSDAFTFFGSHMEVSRLNIILPIGISFYTFQGLSYSIDSYNRKMEPTKDIISFFTYVSFFPQLVAGPIERAYNLLPQFTKRRVFEQDKAIDGLRQILWGLFKKIVIADKCAPFVQDIFANYTVYSGSTLVLGAILFTIQLYCDFSGYSDIAIGTARLFGFNLRQNFAYPFFSRNMPELWRRWHISLTSWFQDYVYFPLGGSRFGKWMKIRNIFIVFLLSGLWHGANWTYIFWGFMFAVFLLPSLLADKANEQTKIVAEGKLFPTFKELFQMFGTFMLVVLVTVFFRVPNIQSGMDFMSRMISKQLFAVPQVFPINILFLIVVFMVAEWLNRDKKHALEIAGSFSKPIRWGIYYTIALVIVFYGGNQQTFIYFQF